MRFGVIIGVIVGLIFVVIAGWFIYTRFIRPRVVNKTIAKFEGKDADNPSVESSVESSVETHDTTSKWKEFKFSKRVNETKINNDIAINESNLFDNPDFEDIFKRPVESDKSLYSEDKVDESKINTNMFKTISYDTYAYPEPDKDIKPFDDDETINITALDDVEFVFKNIESALSIQTEEEQPPKVVLIDGEVFGW